MPRHDYLSIPESKRYEYERTYQLKNDAFEGSGYISLHKPLAVYLPLYRIRKGITDFFKPFKSDYQFKHVFINSILQPLYGVGNILFGFGLAANLPWLSLDTVKFPDACPTKKQLFISSLLYTLIGVSQILSWPLMALQIPFRILLTLMITIVKEAPSFEDSKSVRKLVSLYPTQNEGTQKLIIATLVRKADKLYRTTKQATKLNMREVSILIEKTGCNDQDPDTIPLNSNDSNTLISMFKTAINARDPRGSSPAGGTRPRPGRM